MKDTTDKPQFDLDQFLKLAEDYDYDGPRKVRKEVQLLLDKALPGIVRMRTYGASFEQIASALKSCGLNYSGASLRKHLLQLPKTHDDIKAVCEYWANIPGLADNLLHYEVVRQPGQNKAIKIPDGDVQAESMMLPISTIIDLMNACECPKTKHTLDIMLATRKPVKRSALNKVPKPAQSPAKRTKRPKTQPAKPVAPAKPEVPEPVLAVDPSPPLSAKEPAETTPKVLATIVSEPLREDPMCPAAIDDLVSSMDKEPETEPVPTRGPYYEPFKAIDGYPKPAEMFKPKEYIDFATVQAVCRKMDLPSYRSMNTLILVLRDLGAIKLTDTGNTNLTLHSAVSAKWMQGKALDYMKGVPQAWSQSQIRGDVLNYVIGIMEESKNYSRVVKYLGKLFKVSWDPVPAA
ncbi:hypothetical protein Peetri_00093 [Pseudomonas phage vB_PpuM-Peetri]